MQPDPYAPGSRYHQDRRWTQPHARRCLEEAIAILGRPDSLLDVGCAEGGLVTWAHSQGIHARGIDLAAPDDPAFVRADLRVAIELHRRFEWVLCWEVAEHLPASAAETLIDTLTRHAAPTGRILFTAAPPGQRGPGHIHCAPPAFWDGLFAERGWDLALELTQALRRRWRACAPKTPWYGQNAAVYWRVA